MDETHVAVASRKLSLEETQVAYKAFTGMSLKELAEKFKISKARIQRILTDDDVKNYLTQLQKKLEAYDAPTEAERQKMLWRIAESNESHQPKTSIQAIVELNRMSQLTDAPNQIQINIQNNIGRSALDD